MCWSSYGFCRLWCAGLFHRVRLGHGLLHGIFHHLRAFLLFPFQNIRVSTQKFSHLIVCFSPIGAVFFYAQRGLFKRRAVADCRYVGRRVGGRLCARRHDGLRTAGVPRHGAHHRQTGCNGMTARSKNLIDWHLSCPKARKGVVHTAQGSHKDARWPKRLICNQSERRRTTGVITQNTGVLAIRRASALRHWVGRCCGGAAVVCKRPVCNCTGVAVTKWQA